MADDKFKLPRSSYDELVKIIRAYGRSRQDASINDVAQSSGIHKVQVSANNAFLLGVEIIEGERTKNPTQKGSDLALALEHEIPEEIGKAWRKIITENDFLNKMVQAINVRKGMEISHLENHIAYSAGEAKSKAVMTGARAVADILRVSGLVREEGDKVLPNSQFIREADRAEKPEISQSNIFVAPQDSKVVSISGQRGNVNVNIEVRINVSADELDGLGEKLKNLIDSLSDKTSSI